MPNFTKNAEITTRNHKLWKILYNYKILKKFLFHNNLFFFFYDFINIEDTTILKTIAKAHNLKIIKIKKKTTLALLLNSEYKALNNILINNVLIITAKENAFFFNKEFYNALLNIKSIYLTGVWINNKLYRPSEYQTLITLNDSIKAKPILIIKQLIYILKNSLSLKKK